MTRALPDKNGATVACAAAVAIPELVQTRATTWSPREQAEETGSSVFQSWNGAGPVESKCWVAVKELSLRYYTGEAILTIVYTQYGELD